MAVCGPAANQNFSLRKFGKNGTLSEWEILKKIEKFLTQEKFLTEKISKELTRFCIFVFSGRKFSSCIDFGTFQLGCLEQWAPKQDSSLREESSRRIPDPSVKIRARDGRKVALPIRVRIYRLCKSLHMARLVWNNSP